MTLNSYLPRVLAAAALCGAALDGSGQLTQSYTNTFDTASSVDSWEYMWYAVENQPLAWDSTMDAASNANSGSMKVAIPWGSNAQQLWGGTWGNTSTSDNLLEMNGAYITNISCDVHVDPSSPATSGGNYGPLEFGFQTQYSITYPNNNTVYLPLSATNGWIHLSVPVATTSAGLRGIGFQMNTYSGALNGTTLFWLDNLKTEATLNYTNSFDAARGNNANPGSTANSWIYWQGVNAASSSIAWDSTTDADGSSSSGSLKISIPWKNGNSTGANLSQTMFGTFANRSNFDNGETASGFNFQSLYCSIHVDPSSPMNAAGNYGELQIGFVNEVNGTWNSVIWPASTVTLNASATNGWTNIVVPINYAAAGLGSVSGIFLGMQTFATNGGGLPGTTLLWVDNVGATAFVGTGPAFTSASQSGANLVLNGVNPNCPSGLCCVMLSSTNLALPMSQWTPVATNLFNSDGTFSFTNAISPSQPAMYFSFAPYVTVTVQANSPGCSFSVDGTPCTSSQTFNWIPGSSHTITTSSPQSGGAGIQHVWSNWSDGGAISHTVSPTAGTTYTANFTTQISVTVQPSSPGCTFTVDGTNYTASQIFSWSAGTAHTIATTTPQSGGAGIQYLWSGWSDGGAISHTVSPTAGTTYTANFTIQFYLTMNSQAGGGVSPASGWYNSGAVVAMGASGNEGYDFISWTGSGSGSYSGSNSVPNVMMNGPISETANFTIETGDVSVTVQANPPNCYIIVDQTEYTTNETFGWIPGSDHTISTLNSQSGGAGVRYVWSNWSDGGAMTHTVSPATDTNYTVNFTTQYFLTMSAGSGGSVSPASGWNNTGAVLPIIATASNGNYFNTWTGSGSGSYSGTNNSPSVTMNGPITEAASFTVNTLPPVTSFIMSSNMGVAPFTVTFTDTSSRNPTSWLWTFGDGGTSTLQNPSHTFTNIWRQTVTLTASNAYGTNTSSQPVYQCFPCDAVYDWTDGVAGQIVNTATLSNSLVPGSSQIGYFTTTNFDVPQNNLRGIIFTNIPGMTNGCPVVFSNGAIYSNFNTTNALAYCFTNQHEQYDLRFNSSLVITDIVLLFYESMPIASNVYEYCIDELNIGTTKTGYDLGLLCLNRDLGLSGGQGFFPAGQSENDCHTLETCVPTTYGNTPCTWLTNQYFNGSQIFALHDKMYRVLIEENTNSMCVCAIADPVTSTLMGFVTNYNLYEEGNLIIGYANGHTSFEVMTNNGLGEAGWTNLTSILANHSIISINRPLTWFQATNVAMFGP